VSEIQEHIADKFEELPDHPDDIDIVYELEQVGEPEEIAQEARERFGVKRSRPTWAEPIAIILLLLGGFLWGIGWIAGVVLLWLSDVWSTRDKLIGTLLVPGGLALSFLFLFVVPLQTCYESTTTGRGGTETTSGCSGGISPVLTWALPSSFWPHQSSRPSTLDGSCDKHVRRHDVGVCQDPSGAPKLALPSRLEDRTPPPARPVLLEVDQELGEALGDGVERRLLVRQIARYGWRERWV